jgi:hypothetical protein
MGRLRAAAILAMSAKHLGVFARYPGLPLAEARKVAAGLYGQVASGRDPGHERKASRRREVEAKAPVRDRVEAIAKRYLAHAKARVREKTFGANERILHVDVLPVWKGKRLSEITKADVRELLDGIVGRGSPVAANRTLAASRRCSLSRSSRTFGRPRRAPD